MLPYLRLVLLPAFLLQVFLLAAQTDCGCSQCDIPIIADHARTFSLNIAGANTNNLGAAGQGVCEVEIDFAHDFISDLDISLVSPNGIKVDLVNSPAFSDTSYFSRWKIKFKRCQDPASPDPGYAPSFDANASWASNTTYTGSYLPSNSNCLESFNSGTVNGEWKLEVSSSGFRGVGFIYGFKIRFCDPAGINCFGLNYTEGAGEDCSSAVPLPPDVDLLVGNTAPYAPGFAPGFCGTIENDQWYSFVSTCTDITFTITAGYCINGAGVQIALYEDCFSGPIDCKMGCDDCSWESWTVSAATIPGHEYYILIDGFAGDQCDFEFTVPPGCLGDLGDPYLPNGFSPHGCIGSTFGVGLSEIPFGAAGYIWKGSNGALINGQTQITIPGPENKDVIITYGSTFGEVCVAAYNFTDTSDFICFNYTADTTLTLEEHAIVCYQDYPFESQYAEFGAPLFFAPGTYHVLLTDYVGPNGSLYPCDVNLILTLEEEGGFSQLPPIVSLGSEYVLPDGSVINSSGVYLWSDTLASGCTEDHAQNIFLIDYTLNGDGCAPDTVTFMMPGGVLLECPGGVPGFVNGVGPQKVWYSSSGTYDLIAHLGAQNFLFADTLKLNLTLPPQANFNTSVLQNVLTVNNISQNATGYLWDFGDGSSSTEANPTHPYSAPGTYTVTLTALGPCPATIKSKVIIIGGELPLAGFQVSAQVGCSPMVVQYTNQSLGDPGSFLWEFPGGMPASSTEENPVVTYLNPGTYTATLTIQNVFGQSTLTQNAVVEVSPLAEAGFSVSIVQNQISLTNLSQNADSYLWDFGDGNTSTDPAPIHTYTLPGEYTITLIANGLCDQSLSTQVVTIAGQAPQAAFLASPAEGCIPLIVQFQDVSTGSPESWSWAFPGGMPDVSTAQNPSVIYLNPGTYSATLTVQNAFGEDTVVQSSFISVSPLPTVLFTMTAQAITVEFANQSQNADNYLWDFGDAQTSSESNPIHTYSEPGTYLVTLQAINTCGNSILQQWVTVMASGSVTLQKNSWLSVTPNPSNGYFQLEIRDEPASEYSWQLYNALGQALDRRTLGAFEGSYSGNLDFTQLPPAVYWLEVRIGGRNVWVRLVIE